VIILFFCAVHCSLAADTNQVLDLWFSAQTNFHTFTAQVIQTRALQVLSEPLVSTGKVWIAMPDHFRWEIGRPAQTIALRQPDSLFIIYPRLKRVEKYPLTGSQPGQWRDVLALLDASFPKSRAVMEAQFRVLSIAQTNADWQMALQPRSALARRLVGEIDICVRTNDFALAATEMKFADGSRMRNDFTNIVLNPVLPEGCFDLKTEPDYTIVEPLRQ
jgi:outer membrane lipoprotein-sorting protein